MNGPKCSLCGKEHWLRVNCKGEPHMARTYADDWLAAQSPIATLKRSAPATKRPAPKKGGKKK